MSAEASEPVKGGQFGDDLDKMGFEKSFRYLFDEGEVRASYKTHDHLRIQLKVFKRTTVSEDVRLRLKQMLDTCETNGVEIDMSEVRQIVDPELQAFRRQAFAEFTQIQTQTAGIQVSAEVTKFCIPEYFERVIDAYSNNTGIDAYPFNFGVRVRSVDDPSRMQFYCLANDDCRTKRTCLQINRSAFHFPSNSRLTPKKYPSDEEVVLQHLQSEHWAQLVQLKYV